MRKISVNEGVVTTREAGEMLGVAVRTIQLWVGAGVLPAWRTAGGHRRIPRDAVEKLLAERKHDLAPPEARTPGFKLLLVEDDPTAQNLFASVVAHWDFPVHLTLAANGFEGLVSIGATRPDMVVTDLVMPGMNGFDMLRALKSARSGFASLTLAVVSGLSPQEIAEQGGLPDGVAYFQKPLHFDRMRELVYSTFQRHARTHAV